MRELLEEFYFWRAVDLSRRGQNRLALGYLQELLESWPDHVEGLVAAGESYLAGNAAAEGEREECDGRALECFERALALEPRHAGACAGKGLALLYLGRPAEALAAAESGFNVLSDGVGMGMGHEGLRANVTEALYDRKIRALVELGRLEDARSAFDASLRACGINPYLQRLAGRLGIPREDQCPLPWE